MCRKLFFAFFILTLAGSTAAEAQVYMRGRVRMGSRYGARPPRARQRYTEPFTPTVTISVGYGFPNVDKNLLPDYYGTYRGNISQTGPITGALDYQFSRSTSLGVMVTHGNVSAPYYDYNISNSVPAFTARLDNWSFMLNLMKYFSSGGKVSPYLRLAGGINSWKQTYTDPSGSKAAVLPVELPDFAYQAGLGAKFNLSKNAGIFVEAGYGKYTLHGGLALKF